MYELEEGEILGRHAGQGVEVGACPIENPDVVDIVDAASMSLSIFLCMGVRGRG